MDTSKRNIVSQRRAEDWDEVLLYEELRQGPKTRDAKDDTNSEWLQTLDKLHLYLRKKDNQRRLLRRLLNFTEIMKDWTEEEFRLYLDDATNLCTKIINYTKISPSFIHFDEKCKGGGLRTPDPAYWRQDVLRDVGQHVHEILAKQSRQPRSMEELFRDFLNAGNL